ncbi:MAG: hypothetical protein JST06_03120 [Bacteroidetes bacterium]|nr:hypothetical protein [Bacteroidota bacterium]MBS1628815.1 hypothetical protein [Bacteroidota bacterium]
MNKLFLFLVMLPKGLYQKLGADTEQLRALLDVKLKLDDRKPIQIGRGQKQKKNRRFSSLLGVLISFFTGLIYVFPLLLVEDRLSALWLFFTMFLFLLTFTLISDFSSVLFDTRDKYIIHPRPVSDQTLFLSRLLHVFIYLTRIVLPMSISGWVVLGIMYGWKAAVFFPLPLLLLVITALFAVMGIYLLMLRVASGEKFKELLSYFQIAFSVIIFGTYYLVPRAMDAAAAQHFRVAQMSWAPFTPSYWLSATFSWVRVLDPGIKHILLLGALAVIFPLLLLWLSLRYLAPQFAARLNRLDTIESSETHVPPSGTEIRPGGRKPYMMLARLLNRQPAAQAGFIMVWLHTARSRSFKMKVYPMFAYVPIYFVYLMLQSKHSLAAQWQHLPETSSHLILLYMCSVVMLQAFSFLGISEQYKAAWIYYAVPLEEPGALFAGAFKVVWIKYFLPFFAAVTVFVLLVWGPSAWVDVALALVNITLFAASVARISYRRFPFSQIDHTATGGSKFLRVLLGMSIPAALGIGHYLAMHLLWLKLLYLTLSSILLWLVWDSYLHTKWEAVKADA